MMRNHNGIIIFISILFLIAFSYVFYSHYMEMKDKTIDQELSEYKMIAFQTAIGIETQLNMIAKDLSFKAARKPIKYFKHTDDIDFVNKKYIEMNDGVIKAVTRTDSNANIIYTYPYNKDAIGTNISYQEHMKKLLSNHEPVISEVFQAVQGYEAIAIHFPIITDGKYDGSFAYLVSFSELLSIYSHKLGVDKKEITRLILSSKGIILNSSNPETTGKDIYGMLKKDAALSSKIEKILSEEENVISYDYKSKKRVGFYIKINLPYGNYWKILYSIDESSIISELHDFINKALLLLVLLIAGILYSINKIFSFNRLAREQEERKAIEHNLRGSRRLYRAIIKDITSIICRFNMEGRILFFNRSAVIVRSKLAR